VNTLSASIAAGETGPLITLSGSVDITNLAELSEVLADPRVNVTLHLTIDASGLSFADSMVAVEVHRHRRCAGLSLRPARRTPGQLCGGVT
jgi:hypothetical protein